MSDERSNLLLGQIDGKVDMILDHVKSHNERITLLENDRDRFKGALWGVGLGSTGLGALLAKIIPFSGH